MSSPIFRQIRADTLQEKLELGLDWLPLEKHRLYCCERELIWGEIQELNLNSIDNICHTGENERRPGKLGRCPWGKFIMGTPDSLLGDFDEPEQGVDPERVPSKRNEADIDRIGEGTVFFREPEDARGVASVSHDRTGTGQRRQSRAASRFCIYIT
jgi:hypothetical protein